MVRYTCQYMALAGVDESAKMSKQELIDSLAKELANHSDETVRYVYRSAYEIDALEKLKRDGETVSDDEVLAIIKNHELLIAVWWSLLGKN